MASHEEFLELCAAATAGELRADEQVRLNSHLAMCRECRQAMSEYEAVKQVTFSTVAQELGPTEGAVGDSWSVEEAEKTFFKRLDRQQKHAQWATSDGGHAEGLMP